MMHGTHNFKFQELCPLCCNLEDTCMCLLMSSFLSKRKLRPEEFIKKYINLRLRGVEY